METTSPPPVAISTSPPVQPASDFRRLRAEGIRWIQQLAATTWTDHNTHDPGITILDVLCYAITDLSYRLDFDIKDLLATPGGKGYESLYSPATVLTVNPVTLQDFKKIMLDVEGVKNAWINKHTAPVASVYFVAGENSLRLTNPGNTGESLVLKGLYNCFVSMMRGSVATVEERLQRCRNLCEDYQQVTELAPQYFAISGTIEIGQTEDINQTAANMLARITRFVTPVVRFYTLAEMLAKGKSTDEIFNGPALAHGFIDNDELNNSNPKTELHTSDVIREMMDEPGVLRVSNVSSYFNTPGTAARRQNWFLTLNSTQMPTLDIEETNGLWLAERLVFQKNGVALTTNKQKIKEWYYKALNAENHPTLPLRDRDIVPEPGTYYPLGEYYSIQHHFPQLYGIGDIGLPTSASPARKAAAKQLKAYLLFFEQILANYYAQAAHLKDLFSFTNPYACTYFYQPLQGVVPGAGDLFVPGSDAQRIAGYTEAPERAQERQNRLLNHLVARFGESLSAYSLHEKSYEQQQNTTAHEAVKTEASEKLVSAKRRFLFHYPLISNERAKAYNYQLSGRDAGNVSGLQKRIAAKMGIDMFSQQSPADGEGFYLLEHLLLRPVAADNLAIIPYYITNTIDAFTDAGEKQTTCISLAHGLLNGEEVVISDATGYNGIYRVIWLSTDEFRIDAPFVGVAGSKPAKWARFTDKPNDTLLVYNKPILRFAKNKTDATTTVCMAPAHGLATGANITITGTQGYDGSYFNITVTGEDAFLIAHPFSKEDSGRWALSDPQKDVYSLQLTFMFPARAGRFANKQFCTFAENTVREETPVHLTVYLRWLAADTMYRFAQLFQHFTQRKTEDSSTRQRITTPGEAAAARLAANRTAWRASRNSLADMLPLGISTYPLADIPILIPERAGELVIQYGEPATIHLLYSQPDVVYRVKDSKGTLMNASKEDEQNKGTDGPLLLKTVSLTQDTYLFSIEAANPLTNLSVRLFQTVAVRIGINTTLRVTAEKDAIEYDTTATVTVLDGQSGTIYELMDASGKKSMSDPVKSSGGDVCITTKSTQAEDFVLTIKATNAHTKQSSLLDTRVEIKVYPNTALEKTLDEPQVADYNGSLSIILKKTQQTASYAVRFEDIDDDSVNKAALQNTTNGQWVQGNNGTIRLELKQLTEDLTVSIIASKNDSKLSKVLPGTLFIPVKPDNNKVLSIEEGATIAAGEMATIRVANTQPGILYQLRQVNKDKTFTNIGNPVFHHRNHGVGTARIETDFAIGRFESTFVLLPAGVVEQTTTFNVLATKATTRQQSDLGNIKVTIKK